MAINTNNNRSYYDTATGTWVEPFNLKNMFAKFKNKFSNVWNKGSGIQLGKIGKMSNIGSGITQGVQALGNISDISRTNTDIDALRGDILSQYSSNPLANSFLTADQKKAIRQLRRGNYDLGGSSGIMSGIGSGLGNAATSAITGGLIGGIPGALIGGLGTLVNSGLQGYNQEQLNKSSELEALYQALADANAQYQSMKRPNMSGLGLQQRYVNMYQ